MQKKPVRYARHPLDIEEIQAHIAAGKLPTKLALSWDERVSFVLTEGLQIKKLAFLDAATQGQSDDGGFDADVALATGELRQFIPDLIEALGGESDRTLHSSQDGAPLAASKPGTVTDSATAPVDTDPGSALPAVLCPTISPVVFRLLQFPFDFFTSPSHYPMSTFS